MIRGRNIPGEQDFDRHVAIELRVVGSVDACHPAAAQWFEYVVLAKRLPFLGRRGHQIDAVTGWTRSPMPIR